MEFAAVNDHLKHLAPNGVTLNIQDRLSLNIALQQLQTELGFETLFLWGKIEGKCSPLTLKAA